MKSSFLFRVAAMDFFMPVIEDVGLSVFDSIQNMPKDVLIVWWAKIMAEKYEPLFDWMPSDIVDRVQKASGLPPKDFLMACYLYHVGMSDVVPLSDRPTGVNPTNIWSDMIADTVLQLCENPSEGEALRLGSSHFYHARLDFSEYLEDVGLPANIVEAYRKGFAIAKYEYLFYGP